MTTVTGWPHRTRYHALSDRQAPFREHSVPVAAGRVLGIAEFGDPDGLPVLWFHGTPGSRRQVPFAARDHAAAHGLRLIAVERPGVGASTPHLYVQLLDFAHDIRVLADRLELSRFGLVGLSGGGPYVLACAWLMPDRVLGAAVFGGVAPTHGSQAPPGGLVYPAVRAEAWLSRLQRPLGALLSGAVRALHPVADAVFDAVLRFGPVSETRVLGQVPMRAMFVDDLLQGSRSGLHAVVYDIILFARPWGFDLREIRVPVCFWQGTDDPLVPLAHAEAMAAQVPEAGLIVCEGSGHLAGMEHAVQALEFLRARALRPAKKRAARKAAPSITKPAAGIRRHRRARATDTD